jgi:uncharacterized glyoxalase superfamily protein PhnB
MTQEHVCSKGNIIPAMRYRDAPGAIEWLCRAFGFEKQLVVAGDAGSIAHAQLVLGNGMIMLGSTKDDEFDRLTTTPGAAGAVTQSPYVIVCRIDEHYQRARAAGADIVGEIEDQDYGGRLYSARDPEGHLWHFGSYDPWA